MTGFDFPRLSHPTGSFRTFLGGDRPPKNEASPPHPGGQGVLNKLAERFRTAPRARGARGRVHSRGKSAARARRARRARAARAHVEKRAARAAVYIISGLTLRKVRFETHLSNLRKLRFKKKVSPEIIYTAARAARFPTCARAARARRARRARAADFPRLPLS